MSKLRKLKDNSEDKFKVFKNYKILIKKLKAKKEYISQTQPLGGIVNKNVNIITEFLRSDILEYKNFSDLDQKLESHKNSESSNKREYVKKIAQY